MNTPSQEDLLGYVLGALDAQEQRDLQQLIDNDPSVEETLLDLKSALTPLDCLDVPGPRPGLARRTCEAVANWDPKSAAARLAFLDHTSIDWEEGIDSHSTSGTLPQHAKQPCNTSPVCSGPDESILPVPCAQSPTTDATTTHALPKLQPALASGESRLRSSWSIRDVCLATAALAVLAALLLPALSSSRHSSQVLACQSNLRQVGIAFRNYSAIHDGGFVAIPRDGNLAVSGCFGPILKDAGLLENDALLSCAGVASDQPPVVIPTLQQVESATDQDQRQHYRQTMGGHFGYSMGYRDGNNYRPPHEGLSQMILLADRPSTSGDRQSGNHGGRGQNCLFSDGRVEFVSGPEYGSDLVYLNDYGVVGPGSNVLDNVIAPSHLSPVF